MAVLSVERLKGLDLYDRDGERVGDIRDVLIDPEDGIVRYALVGTGGLLAALGIQDKLFAIPCSRLTVGEDRVRLEARREVLKDAPSFSPYQPPQFTQEYESRLHDFWGVRPYWQQPGYRLSQRHVGDLMVKDMPILRPDTLVSEAAEMLARSGNAAAPVVDERGQYLGIITAQQLAEIATSGMAPRRHGEEEHAIRRERGAVRGREVAGEEERLATAREAAYERDELLDQPKTGERRMAQEPATPEQYERRLEERAERPPREERRRQEEPPIRRDEEGRPYV